MKGEGMNYDPMYECCGCGKKFKTHNQTINHTMNCKAISDLMKREKEIKEQP